MVVFIHTIAVFFVYHQVNKTTCFVGEYLKIFVNVSNVVKKKVLRPLSSMKIVMCFIGRVTSMVFQSSKRQFVWVAEKSALGTHEACKVKYLCRFI